MNPDAMHPSKERVVRDDVLVYAVGDEIPDSDVDELRRQGYKPGDPSPRYLATVRIERDGILVHAAGDEIPATSIAALDPADFVEVLPGAVPLPPADDTLKTSPGTGEPMTAADGEPAGQPKTVGLDAATIGGLDKPALLELAEKRGIKVNRSYGAPKLREAILAALES